MTSAAVCNNHSALGEDKTLYYTADQSIEAATKLQFYCIHLAYAFICVPRCP